jgi:ankyrin repeat protein
MTMLSLPTRFSRTVIPNRIAVSLIVLAWSSPAFCGEIHDAARNGRIGEVQTLIRGDPSLVFGKDQSGATPLDYAALNDHKDVVELLLVNKADVNARDIRGDAPLDYAAQEQSDSTDVVDLLLANGATVNVRDNQGLSPLHYAAQNGHRAVAALLLANNADVSARNNDGRTPLHLAANKEVAALLLSHDADVNAKDNNGRTPTHLAAQHPGSYQDVAELLRQHGGHE